MRSHRALLYAVAGQAGWFVCVLSAARDAAWIGIVFVAVLLALHLQQARQPQRELRLVVWVVVLAAPWETLLIRAGLIAYPHGTLWAGFAPPWLLALWVLFAIQVNVLFRWLRGRWWLALALGAVAGPLSFRAGAALGAAHISAMAATLGTLAIGWAIWMPLLVRMGEHSDGTGIPP
ncbi:MAG: DUF2878 domain-containing protein [Ralstonia sp.]|jgi:hypothetical protein|uniref:DUF2878 domain-containing protein n=4 Tax=Pseudomonadota TaxID=1224 RepID=A0AAD2F1T7_9RALS|nr:MULTISPECIES: DUF2878 domain-containing protein [Ralstonia]MEA3269733.1 DUF2878 domain-containing protein [Pseudomonadota bacterium]EFP67226.1 hypothetical protein HMPREF1004_00998 [Ralstonia pickettii]EGY61844.1 hypothetical protein HMPREF0989_03960 [Ralstonia sp. 5_2_56FAA]ENZ75545.1 hypothetical protein OR214_04530 [Ralstonia pickettii OR214]KFL21544.1 hypothetical protein DP23_3525 [Ralstonia pickettii]